MNHCFKPITINTFLMKRTSNDDNGTEINLFDASIELDFNFVYQSIYVCCIYEDNWYIGMVIDKDEEEKYVLVNFIMENRKINYNFYWPTTKDV